MSENNAPKVTVLTPTFNRPGFLGEAIKSVLSQELENWEMIIVNDGGMKVGHIVDSFNDKRLIHIDNDKNKGKSACLNQALKIAKGEYVAYLDDDDIWYPNHLKALSEALDRSDDSFGAAYSDLYGVQCVRNLEGSKRYPLHKWIQASRDYNRFFTFNFNHVLHVSLMHTKELADRVGGYDETVKVLIDWNMTRKLSFFTEFIHVPLLTGEYYMPFNITDRISCNERVDKEKYKHNLRRTRADLPPEPWEKVKRVGVVFPINEWGEKTKEFVTMLADHISYPVRYVIINRDLSKNRDECLESLGELAELKNIHILCPEKEISPLESYRMGAQLFDFDYVYLPSVSNTQKREYRVMTAVDFMEYIPSDGLKWGVPEEKSGPYDSFLKRDKFLEATDPDTGSMDFNIKMLLDHTAPAALLCDMFFTSSKKEYDKGNLSNALENLKRAETIWGGKGAIKDTYMISKYAEIYFECKKFDEAEKRIRVLMDRGYGADNYVRLARILEDTGRFSEAIEFYHKGLNSIGLSEEDLEDGIFPIQMDETCNSFICFMGLGECYLETGAYVEAARMFHRAAKISVKSLRPYLGFGKLFTRTGQLKQAEESLVNLFNKSEKTDRWACQALGELREQQGRYEEAYCLFKKAFDLEKYETIHAASLHRAGEKLGRWNEVRLCLEEFLSYRPGVVKILTLLADVYFALGLQAKALETVGKGLSLSPGNDELMTMSSKFTDNMTNAIQ